MRLSMKSTAIPQDKGEMVFQDYTPAEFIAGVIPTTRNSWEAAWHAAVVALDTEAVRLVTSEHKGKTWYIAAPASAFASNPNATCVLSNALPGMPRHEGDGAYIGQVSHRQTGCIIIQDGHAYCYTGENEEAREFAQQYSAPIHEATGDAVWQGYNEKTTAESQKSAMFAIKAALFFIGFGVLLWLGLAALRGASAERASTIQAEWDRNVGQIVQTFNASRLSQVRSLMADLHTLSSRALAAKGRITKYSIHNGKLTWEMELPLWVTSDYYQDLGGHAEVVNDKVTVTKEMPWP